MGSELKSSNSRTQSARESCLYCCAMEMGSNWSLWWHKVAGRYEQIGGYCPASGWLQNPSRRGLQISEISFGRGLRSTSYWYCPIKGNDLAGGM